MLQPFTPCVLQLSDEGVFVLIHYLLYFLPCGWAILILYFYNAMNNFVKLPLVFFRNFDSSFLEDFLDMPKIACRGKFL
jgi:hypothetical protein